MEDDGKHEELDLDNLPDAKDEDFSTKGDYHRPLIRLWTLQKLWLDTLISDNLFEEKVFLDNSSAFFEDMRFLRRFLRTLQVWLKYQIMIFWSANVQKNGHRYQKLENCWEISQWLKFSVSLLRLTRFAENPLRIVGIYFILRCT